MATEGCIADLKTGGINGAGVTHRAVGHTLHTDGALFDRLARLLKQPGVDPERVIKKAEGIMATFSAKELLEQERRSGMAVTQDQIDQLDLEQRKIWDAESHGQETHERETYSQETPTQAPEPAPITPEPIPETPEPQTPVKQPETASTGASDILRELDGYPPMLTPSEVQTILRISPATFYRMLKDGRLVGVVKVGNQVRVVRDRLRDWLIEQSG